MKFLIMPDLHFGQKSFGRDHPDKLNSRIQDQLYLMEFIYETAKKQNIDQLIMTGDVFDKENPEPILISTFFKWLTKCAELFRVDIVVGNHDIKRVGNNIISILDTIPAARVKNCFIHKTIETLKSGDLSITYIPFFDKKQFSFETNSEATEFIVAAIKQSVKSNKAEKNIAIGHLAIEKSIYVGDEIADECNELFMPVSAFNDFDYTLMGHIHPYQVMSKKPYVAHLGSVDKKSFSESDKFICMYDSEKNTIKYIKLPCRNLVDINVSIPSDVKDTNEYIKNEINKYSEQLPNAIVRIKVDILANDAEIINKKEIYKLLADMNIQHLAEMIEKKSVGIVETKTDIDETTNPYKAIDLFLPLIDADETFKQEVSIICKEIIKNVLGEQK